MGEVVSSWNGDGVFTGRDPCNPHESMTPKTKGLIVLIGISLVVLAGRHLSPTFDTQMEKAPVGFQSTFHRNAGDIK